MKITLLNENQNSKEGLFPNYLIEDFQSIKELLEIYYNFRKEYENQTIIFTLDDLNQAEYTSMHATMFHDLDETEGHDLSKVDPKAFENGEHIGHLTTPSEFFIRKINFEKKSKTTEFVDACDKGLFLEKSELELLEKINKDPLVFLDKKILLKIIPVQESYYALSGFPNGYFSSDLDPFENYAVAKHLKDNYDYDLMGIGASLLGFIRTYPLTESEKENLVNDLLLLYEVEESLLDYFKKTISLQSNYLFLKYTEFIE